MGVKIKWLGQSGLLFDSGKLRVCIDAYLTDHVFETFGQPGLKRMRPAPLSPENLNADFYCISHDHADHYDPKSVAAAAAANARFIGSESAAGHFAKDGHDCSKFVPLRPGDEFSSGGMRMRAVPAKHSDASAVGFVLELGDLLLYASADTLYFPELAGEVARAAGGKIDAAFVCINGKLGNMNWREAAQLVEALQPRLAVPMHYGLFADNTEDPTPFLEAVRKKGINCREPSESGFEI